MNEIIRIPNINNYEVKIINNELFLIPILSKLRNYITNEEELFRKDLTNSSIIYCIIKDNDNFIEIPANYPHIRCLINLYTKFPKSFILSKTKLKVSLKKENYNNIGFIYYPEIEMSIDDKDTNESLKEIMNMIRINNFKIELGIVLSNGDNIYYKNF